MHVSDIRIILKILLEAILLNRWVAESEKCAVARFAKMIKPCEQTLEHCTKQKTYSERFNAWFPTYFHLLNVIDLDKIQKICDALLKGR